MHFVKLYILNVLLFELDFSYDQADFDFIEAEDASHEGIALFVYYFFLSVNSLSTF